MDKLRKKTALIVFVLLMNGVMHIVHAITPASRMRENLAMLTLRGDLSEVDEELRGSQFSENEAELFCVLAREDLDETKKIACVSQLVAKKVNMNMPCPVSLIYAYPNRYDMGYIKNNITPLIYLLNRSYYKTPFDQLLQCLIKGGMDVNQPDDEGTTPLDAAMRALWGWGDGGSERKTRSDGSMVKAIEVLLDAGATLTVENFKDGMLKNVPALHSILYKKSPMTIIWLAQKESIFNLQELSNRVAKGLNTSVIPIAGCLAYQQLFRLKKQSFFAMR